MNNSITRHEIWEEVLFGDTDRYRRVVDAFPNAAEHLETPNVKPHAESVVKYVLSGTPEELLRAAMDDNRRFNTYGFAEWLRDEVYSTMGDCPSALVKEVVEALPEDLEEPNELPVRWPDS